MAVVGCEQRPWTGRRRCVVERVWVSLSHTLTHTHSLALSVQLSLWYSSQRVGTHVLYEVR